jgi:hypothetical protein
MPRRRSAAWKVSWDLQPLGKIPDVELARRLSVPLYNVQHERRERNIPACPRDRWGQAVREPTDIAKLALSAPPKSDAPQPTNGRIKRKKRSSKGLHDDDPLTIERALLALARTMRHLLTRLGPYSLWEQDCDQIKRALVLAGPFITDEHLRQIATMFSLPEMSFAEDPPV